MEEDGGGERWAFFPSGCLHMTLGLVDVSRGRQGARAAKPKRLELPYMVRREPPVTLRPSASFTALRAYPQVLLSTLECLLGSLHDSASQEDLIFISPWRQFTVWYVCFCTLSRIACPLAMPRNPSHRR